MKPVQLLRPATIATSLLLSAFLLAGCKPSAPADTAGSPATAASATPSAEAQAAAASAAAAAGAAVAADAPLDAAAAAPGEPAKPADPVAPPPAATGALVAGVDYSLIPNGQPFEPLNGKVEVVEVFGYICPACARFEPQFSAWKAKVPNYVRVTYVAAPFGPQWIPYARAFYVSDAMGLVEKTHTAMFHAIHLEGSLPGEGQKPDEAAIVAFYAKHGADPKRFLNDMHSFSTEAKINRGKQFMIRTGTNSTPSLVVNGKYRVIGRSYDDMLRITEQLVEMEHTAAGAAAH
ncbi:MAG: thiol:disulfide interchange protein DsbA/DsbL [Luteimonas sp.]